MSDTSEQQVVGLSILVQLSRRVRDAASVEEIGFIAVNESKQLLPYRQAALWLRDGGVFSVSGVPDPDKSSPYIQWLTECCKRWQELETSACSTPDDVFGELSRSWYEWAPYHAAIAPLAAKQVGRFGMLILFREEPWHDNELALLNELASIYGHSLSLAARTGGYVTAIRKKVLTHPMKIACAAAAVACLLLPVRMSVQAPAEVVPKDPFVVRSPLDTVIDKFHVRPNQAVTQGQLLFEFDRTNLSAKYGVASKAYQVAAEEYRQAAQTALVDDKSRAEIMPRLGKMEEKATELAFSRQLLSKTGFRAPRAGIVVFAEQSDWVGKNVAIGERVLTIADPGRVEMLIRLPVADAIDFTLDNPVRLYLASDPQKPLEGTLRYVAYKPEASPAGIVSYRMKADFASSVTPPRIGMTGTARIFGKRVTLGYYLFRRPLTALRQRLGW